MCGKTVPIDNLCTVYIVYTLKTCSTCFVQFFSTHSNAAQSLVSPAALHQLVLSVCPLLSTNQRSTLVVNKQGRVGGT